MNSPKDYLTDRVEKIIGHDLHCLYNLDEKDCDCGAKSKVDALLTLLTSEVEKERELIKQAFIKEYRGSGEQWFPYESEGNCTKEEEQEAIEREWDEVMEQRKALSDIGGGNE